jgi:hypothetical protein
VSRAVRGLETKAKMCDVRGESLGRGRGIGKRGMVFPFCSMWHIPKAFSL